MNLTNKKILIILSLITVFNLYGSYKNSDDKRELYKKGIAALEKDTLIAEKYFRESVRKYDDANSHYQLGKIYEKRGTPNTRNRAIEHYRKAVWKEPLNLEFRYAFASLMKDFARRTSFNEYKKIIALDSSQVNAWLELAKIKDEDFTEYNLSVRKMSDEFYGSLQEYAYKDFYEAEKYYLTALKYDSLNYNGNLKLSLLYENAGFPQKGIPLLLKLVKENLSDKEIHLSLGLLYYKTSQIKKSYQEYKIAIAKMNEEERQDFIFNSVKFLIKPAFEEVVEKYNDFELKEFINTYWQVFDPLYLTDYNERLLEHYSRVAHANLNFSVPKMGKIGWKTERGEVLLRYGEPIDRMRIRPSMEAGGVAMKTDVWNYGDITFGFTDMASSGNFLFSIPPLEKDKLQSQFVGDTHAFMDYLRKVRHSFYDPKFEGQKLSVDYSITQFKSKEKRTHTDLYINYSFSQHDSLYQNNISQLKYRTGLFFFDKNYQEQYRRITEVVTEKNDGEKLVKSFLASLRPDSGYVSFELIRDMDNGTFSDRMDLKIKRYSNNRLDISDILLAGNIETEQSELTSIKRSNLFITPNSNKTFSKNNLPFIYFEVYNLNKGNDGLTNFEQRITIEQFEEKANDPLNKAVRAIKGFLGVGKKEEITLISNYQTFESDPNIYLQLDLSNYPVAKYLITVTIKDNLLNTEDSSEILVDWRN